MKEQITKAWANIKEFWTNLSDKMKKIVVASAGIILAMSIALVVYLNMSAAQMVPLFPKLSSVETTAVCAALSEMGVKAEINSQGEIMVPAEQQGELQVRLAGQGYPQSAPTYDLYLNNTGFTRTEAEKKQIYIYQLQERIQASLMQCEGVQNAVVMITMPESTGYVWDDEKQEGSASLTITMEKGYELSGERVAAIKNLVAFSVVPQMNPNNVKIIDAKTGLELQTEDDALSALGLNDKRLEYEAKVQRRIEDNIKKILVPIYGVDGVHVAAWVTLDYDKMLTQQHQIVPEDDGNGVKIHMDEQYGIMGNVPVQGLVGEENNTDTPVYPNQTGDGENQTTSYNRSIDWENSYINTQIEKGQAIIKDVSVSVVVNDPNFTQERHDNLVNMVSKAANVKSDAISVNNLMTDESAIPADTEPEETGDRRMIVAIIAVCALLLIIIVTVVTILLSRRSKQRLAEEEAESANKIRHLQEEIEQHKRDLVEQAQAANGKENAIANEIRQFAKENPEITANLIRSMLKEDEQ